MINGLKKYNNLLIFLIVFSVTFLMLLTKLGDYGISLPSGSSFIIIDLLFFMLWVKSGSRLQMPFVYYGLLNIMLVYLVFSIIYTLGSWYSYLIGVILTFSFVFVGLLAQNIKCRDYEWIRIVNLLLIIILVMMIFSILDALISLQAIRDSLTLFREVGAMGTAMCCALVMSLSLYIIKNKKKYFYLSIIVSIIIVAAVLKKSFISALFVWIIFSIRERSNAVFKKNIITSLLCVCGALLIFYPLYKGNIVENINQVSDQGMEGQVRGLLYLGAFDIGKDMFPFGSGMGTYASIASFIGGYSSVYDKYNLSSYAVFSPDTISSGLQFMLDAYWAHIIGELGFIGSIIYLCIWFFPLVYAIKLSRFSGDKTIRGMAFYIIGLITVMTIEGVGLYTPENAPFIVFNAGISGLALFYLIQN